MNKHNEKTPHIIVDGEAYEMINVSKTNGELIASITADDIVSEKGYKVSLVKNASKVRFQEMD
ncbi:MAG TPA: hypothetical protein K8W06_04725 [Limosilactobacillus coleohominis]|nr:hypothetical protein [Limosilactobacillus coleohominis]